MTVSSLDSWQKFLTDFVVWFRRRIALIIRHPEDKITEGHLLAILLNKTNERLVTIHSDDTNINH